MIWELVWSPACSGQLGLSHSRADNGCDHLFGQIYGFGWSEVLETSVGIHSSCTQTDSKEVLYRWEARDRLYIHHNWTFSLSLMAEALKAEIGQSWRFTKGVDHFQRRFQREGQLPTNHCWCQSSRVIALSCGIKISTVHHLALSQSTRVTDRRTNGLTELQLPRWPSHMFDCSCCKNKASSNISSLEDNFILQATTV